MATLSAGVEISELDVSPIVPTVSNSFGVFVGDFTKGPLETYGYITNVTELVDYYGKPTDLNYNDFYQAYNFLQYGNKLLLVRAALITGSFNSGVYVADTAGAIVTDYSIAPILTKNYDDFEASTYPMAAVNDKLFVTARNPGMWGNSIEIAIANNADFGTSADAFTGIALDDLFEYTPDAYVDSTDLGEVAVVVKVGDEIKETFLVSLNVDSKDYLNKSNYIMNVINTKSSYIFVHDDSANTLGVGSAIDASSLILTEGIAITPTSAELLTGYELFENKEELDIDIVIGNETDSGVSANALATTREDCITFIGAEQVDTVGLKSSAATTALLAWRSSGSLNYNNMFTVSAGNYKYQYDRYSDKNRWVNLAGDIAGLRAQTSTNRAAWWASAGLERGQIKNVIKLAFNPNQAQRDSLYKVGINPVVSFPGQGTVMWGQKTLLSKPSSFDRVNVRGLFNTLERALGKMAKYQVMEFNDTFTRNRIVSMIKPYLGSVKAGRGIQEYLVICDESNNTADVISRNQLVVDIYIKPTYVAEFIQLRFTNAGTNSFAEIISA